MIKVTQRLTVYMHLGWFYCQMSSQLTDYWLHPWLSAPSLSPILGTQGYCLPLLCLSKDLFKRTKCWHAWTAISKYYRLGDSQREVYFLIVLEAGRLRSGYWQVSSEASFHGLQVATFLLCPHMAFSDLVFTIVSPCLLISSSYEDLHRIGLGPALEA